jgi:hypothetical protein
MSNISVAALDQLAKKLDDLKTKKTAQEAEVKNTNKEITSLAMDILKHLQELDREEYISPYGKLKIKDNFQITSPKGDGKLEFVSHLKEIGIYEQVASVHAATVKTIAQEAYAKAMKEPGFDPMTWEFFGVKPTTFKQVDLTGRKSKGIESDVEEQE